MSTIVDSMRDLIETIDAKYGENIAYQYLECGEVVSKTYHELAHKAKSVSSYLQENGYHRVAIGVLGTTSYSWACSYLGIQLSNNIVVPMDPSLFLDDYISIVNRAEIQLIFMSTHYKKLSSELLKKCPSLSKIIIFEEDFQEINTISTNEYQVCKPEDVGQLMFTSGTTGLRKIVMLSYANIIANINLDSLFSPNETAFSVLPSFHCFEIIVGELEILKLGGKICINDKLDNITTNIQRYQPTVMCCVPLIAENLLRYAKKIVKELGIPKPDENMGHEERRKHYAAVLDKAFGGKIRLIVCGGAKIHEEAVQEYHDMGIYLMPGYGLTETAASVTTNHPGRIKYTSVGQPVRKDIYLKIVDGEVLIKGPNVMIGYYRNDEANREVFTEDGWLRTGDLGYIDEDGYLFLTGRKKNLIILESGENVAPEELESHIMDIPNVLNAMVYENKQKISVVIYATEGLDEIKHQIRLLNETMPMYKRIVQISFLDSQFPMTTSKKVKRELVLAQLKSTNHEEEFREADTSSQKEVVEAVKETLGIDEKISINDDYFELGGDSYNTLELAVKLKIDAQLIYDYPKLADLAQQISNTRYVTAQSLNRKDDSVNERIPFQCHKRIETVGNHILLTGATGFLGAHLLRELLQIPDIQVTCLVRSKKRLKNIYEYYFHENVLDKVSVICGDIADKYLGMEENQYYQLAEATDVCIHAAAIVHHVGKYEEFQKINEHGTRNILNFCKTGKVILQYTSTYSVSGIGVVSLSPTQDKFDEDVLYIGQNYEENVYVRSKYEAEKLVLEARQEGVEANIFRIGSLSWRTTDMQFQKNYKDNGLVNKVLGWNEIGCYVSRMAEYWLDFTQVDECAKALTLLAFKNSVNNIYHLFNPNVLRVNDLEKIFDKKYEEVSEEEFFKRTKDKMDNKQIANYVFYNTLALRSKPLFMCNRFTVECLKDLGFEWSSLSKEYILEGLKKIECK